MYVFKEVFSVSQKHWVLNRLWKSTSRQTGNFIQIANSKTVNPNQTNPIQRIPAILQSTITLNVSIKWRGTEFCKVFWKHWWTLCMKEGTVQRFCILQSASEFNLMTGGKLLQIAFTITMNTFQCKSRGDLRKPGPQCFLFKFKSQPRV